MSPSHETTLSIWSKLKQESAAFQSGLSSLDFFVNSLADAASLGDALAILLAQAVQGPLADAVALEEKMKALHAQYASLAASAAFDLDAVLKRDPAAEGLLRPFLFFKGFQALQLHRMAHVLWENEKKDLALFLQSRSSVVFGVDIHPAARIGHGLMIDHATGLVVGETAIIEDDVSLLHGVTLGGNGIERGDRHPKVRRGVMIGADATILGNIEIGEGAVVAAGSMVLAPVPPHVTVAGVPAKVVGKARSREPSCAMDHSLPDEGAFALQ